MTDYRITLDVNKTGQGIQLWAKKGDVGRTLYIDFTDGGSEFIIPSDCIAIFVALKPDGKILYNKADIVGNTVQYKFTAQTVAAEGILECEIRIMDMNHNVVTSPDFSIRVEAQAVNDSEIISKDEVNQLTNLIIEAQRLINEMNNGLTRLDAALVNVAKFLNQKTIPCETEANVADKVVTVPEDQLIPGEGGFIYVSFTRKNTAKNPTLTAGDIKLPIRANDGGVLDAAPGYICQIRREPDAWVWMNNELFEVTTAVITSEVRRLVCDMTANEIIDASRRGVVKAEYTDEASGETREYYYFKQMPDGRAVFTKDGYIENGVPKQTLFYVDYAGNVTVETREPTAVTVYATCNAEAAPMQTVPVTWYVPKDMPKPSGNVGMMIDVFWVNGRADGIGYDISLVWGEEGGSDNEVIVPTASTSDSLTGQYSIPTEGTVRYQLIEQSGRKRWQYVSGKLIGKSFSSDTAAEIADKNVHGMEISYLPGMDIYVQLDKGNTAEVMSLVPDAGDALPVYGNGIGAKTGSISAGYILHLKNAGDHWQIMNPDVLPYVNSTFAPALPVTMTGPAVATDMVSPVEHDVGCKVEGINNVPPYENTTSSGAGITWTADYTTGGITTNRGTPTGYTDIVLADAFTGLRKNIEYTVDTLGKYTGMKFMLRIDKTKGSAVFIGPGQSFKLADIPDYKSVHIYVQQGGGMTSGTLYPVLYTGKKPDKWTPYIPDLSAVTVSQFGKNLANFEQGLLRPNGEITSSKVHVVSDFVPVPPGYTITFSAETGVIGRDAVVAYSTGKTFIRDVSPELTGIPTDIPNNFGRGWENTDAETRLVKMGFNKSGPEITPAYASSVIEIELSTHILEYAKPVLPITFKPSAEGIVTGMTSISPSMTILTDNAGATIEATYNADTKKYIDSKFAELQALTLRTGGM